MNSFREGITNGRAASGPVMPAKKARGTDGDALTGTVIPRAETRTHNQRGETREVLACGEAGLTVGRRSYVVDLLNLSGGGAMIRTNVPLMLWKQVHLELGESGSVECVVRWIRDDRIGLEFAHETQVGGDLAKRDAMLLDTITRNFPEVAGDAADSDQPGVPADPATAEAQRRGGMRHPLIWSGEIHFDHDSTPVRLRNVSETGAMVDCARPFPEGAEVLLDLGRRRPAFRRRDLVARRPARPQVPAPVRHRLFVAVEAGSGVEELDPPGISDRRAGRGFALGRAVGAVVARRAQGRARRLPQALTV